MVEYHSILRHIVVYIEQNSNVELLEIQPWKGEWRLVWPADSSIQQFTGTIRHSDHLEHLLKYNMLNLKHQKEGKQHPVNTAPEQQSQEMAFKETGTWFPNDSLHRQWGSHEGLSCVYSKSDAAVEMSLYLFIFNPARFCRSSSCRSLRKKVRPAHIFLAAAHRFTPGHPIKSSGTLTGSWTRQTTHTVWPQTPVWPPSQCKENLFKVCLKKRNQCELLSSVWCGSTTLVLPVDGSISEIP